MRAAMSHARKGPMPAWSFVGANSKSDRHELGSFGFCKQVLSRIVQDQSFKAARFWLVSCPWRGLRLSLAGGQVVAACYIYAVCFDFSVIVIAILRLSLEMLGQQWIKCSATVKQASKVISGRHIHTTQLPSRTRTHPRKVTRCAAHSLLNHYFFLFIY